MPQGNDAPEPQGELLEVMGAGRFSIKLSETSEGMYWSLLVTVEGGEPAGLYDLAATHLTAFLNVFNPLIEESRNRLGVRSWVRRGIPLSQVPEDILERLVSDDEALEVPFPFSQLRGEDMYGKILGELEPDQLNWLAETQFQDRTPKIKLAQVAARRLIRSMALEGLDDLFEGVNNG